MKKSNLIILILTLLVQGAIAQTITGTFTKIPCNNDGIYSVTTTGLATPITYNYYINGVQITHANVNSTTDQLTNVGMGLVGNIYANAISGTQYASTQTSYTPAFSFSISTTNPVCPATMGSISATWQSGSTGPFSVVWTNTQSSNTYTGATASVPLGEYSVKITDQTTGCVLEILDSAASVVQISGVTASITKTTASCTNGTATAVPSGGMAPYSFIWGNGGNTSTISGLSKGYYSLEVTDAQGCKSSYLGVSITQSPVITVNTTVTNATCLQPDGSALAFGSGGVNPYTYSWSNGQSGNQATNLSGNTSTTVIAEDANGCIGHGYAYIGTNTPINVSYNATKSSCTTPTGSATLTITGGTAPYTTVWNTSPQASGTTLSNVGPGQYRFEVTDAVGCVRTGIANVQPISAIYAYLSSTSALCPNSNGTVTANVSGSSPPFTYQWSNGKTTSSINGLAPDSYSVVITDAMGCSVTKSEIVHSSTPVNVNVSTVPVTCKFNLDGSATSYVSGGVPPYTYSYSSGAKTANATGLGEGDYWLTVTDANGCSSSRHFWILDSKSTDNCYCTIKGNVYLDANTNCTMDVGESGIENIMINCSGFGYTFTDANGEYSFEVPTGSYTITEQINAYYPLASCQNNGIAVSVVAASNCSTVVDIANDINVINDLKMLTVNSTIPPVPGYPYLQKVIVTNMGTVTESNVQMGYEHDGQIPLANSSLASFMQLNPTGAPYAYSVQSGFPVLAPSAESVMLLTYNTPTNIPLSTNVQFLDTVANTAPIGVNWLLDYSPWNNVNTYQTTVVGSYDPNYKEVYPIGEGEEGYISSKVTEFDYTIHFQNEGTYFARNIKITDQLDNDLDWKTFVPGYSDYDYTVDISETGLATFTFADINLPWKSNYGDALSSGLVNYSIQRKSSNPQKTEFTNTANIYFDFNPPITTNTTLNTLYDYVGVEDFEAENRMEVPVTVDMYPVPAKDNISIRVNNVSKKELATMQIVDLLGSVVRSEQLKLNEGSTISTHNISNLSSGTYLMMIRFNDGKMISKKLLMY